MKHRNGLSGVAEMSLSLGYLTNGVKQANACKDLCSVNPALEEENKFRLFLQVSSISSCIRLCYILALS